MVGVTVLKTDLYQLTMAAGYFHRGMKDTVATCEMFVRKLPAHRNYLVACGVDAVIEQLASLRFDEQDIARLRQLPALSDVMTDAPTLRPRARRVAAVPRSEMGRR